MPRNENSTVRVKYTQAGLDMLEAKYSHAMKRYSGINFQPWSGPITDSAGYAVTTFGLLLSELGPSCQAGNDLKIVDIRFEDEA